MVRNRASRLDSSRMRSMPEEVRMASPARKAPPPRTPCAERKRCAAPAAEGPVLRASGPDWVGTMRAKDPGVQLLVFGLAVSSSWGNGHATLWRALCRALSARGHDVTFFERDVPYYAAHRDGLHFPGLELVLYSDLAD